MASIYRYMIENAQGETIVDDEYENYDEAKDYAREHNARVICNEYNWDDSYMVDDFTGSDDEPGDDDDLENETERDARMRSFGYEPTGDGQYRPIGSMPDGLGDSILDRAHSEVLARLTDFGAENAVIMTCGQCGRQWNDVAKTALTPVPSGRCPYEYYHTSREDGAILQP